MPGDLNMAIDIVMGYEAFECGEPLLRFYSWERPTLSFGRHQKPICPTGYDCVIRPTGGRAVLHWDEITYSVVFPKGWGEFSLSVLKLYRKIAEIFHSAFKNLGIPAEISPGFGNLRNPNCFSSSARYELTIFGRKFMGSAQMRTREFVLQHGSILLRYDGRLFEKIFGDPGRAIGLKDAFDLKERDLVKAILNEFDLVYGLGHMEYQKIMELIERAEKIRGDFVCRSCS